MIKQRTNYRRLKYNLKRATDKANKKCLNSIFDEIMDFKRTGCNDLSTRTHRNQAGNKILKFKHRHQRPLREYNRSETSTEN
jgi:hypothetical protein